MPDLVLPSHTRLHYIDLNPVAQPIILLIHGLGANSELWQLQFPSLVEKGFRVLAIDLPGFGKSSYSGEWKSIETISKVISDTITLLEINSVIAIGLSMGGPVCLQFALDAPNRVSRLVLVNTFAHLDIATPRNFLYFLTRVILMSTRGMEAQAEAVAKRVFPHPDQSFLRAELIKQVMASNPSAYRSAMLTLARINLLNRLSEIRQPTLVITGEQDTTVHPDQQAAMAQRIPFANKVVLANTGHAASVENPELFNAALLDFLVE